MSNPLPTSEVVFDSLYEKALANHVSKLSGMEHVPYGTVLDVMSNPHEHLSDRLVTVAELAGNTALAGELIHEAGIMRLCATGRESEVTSNERRAAFTESDSNQERDAVSGKTLDYYLRNGIELVFDPEARAVAQRLCDLDDRNVPLIETLKAQRLLTINGFGDSRVMYAVHDLIDHAWLFNQMREEGIMERYADFLTSVEMGSEAFLYSRQSELLASAGFGSRRWAVAHAQGEQLILDQHAILTVLSTRDESRTAQAAKTLQAMSPTDLNQTLFVLENMAIQLTDERRRWGAVKQVDSAGNRRPMELLDPVYLSLMIETMAMLQKSRTYGRVQLAATVRVEEMLTTALHEPASSETLHIAVPHVTDPARLPDNDSTRWIQQHLGVSTSYNRIG